MLEDNPIHEAVTRCIGDQRTFYDYHNFFPEWEQLPVRFRILVKKLLQVEDDHLDEFVSDITPQYEFDKMTPLIEQSGNQEFLKQLFRFVFALPVCGYELVNTGGNKSASNSRGTDSVFNRTLCDFKYDRLEEISDAEIENVIVKVGNQVAGIPRKIPKLLSNVLFPSKYEVLERYDCTEGDFKRKFIQHLVEPLISFLSTILHSEIAVRQEPFVPPGEPRVIPDLALKRGLDTLCTIEVKEFPVVPDYINGNVKEATDSVFSPKCSMIGMVRQALCQIIAKRTDMGILTDSYVCIFLQIDLEYFERVALAHKRKLRTRKVPLRYKILDCQSSKPSLREMILYFFCKAASSSEKEINTKQERMRQFHDYLRKLPNEALQSLEEFERNSLARSSPASSKDTLYSSRRSASDNETRPPTASSASSLGLDPINEDPEIEKDSLVIDFPSNGTDILLRIGADFNTQVFRIDAHYVKKFLLNQAQPDLKLAVKIYDWRQASREHDVKLTADEVRDFCLESYERERDICKKLSRVKKFNSCYVQHKEGRLLITMDKNYLSYGWFNLYRYVETSDLPRDEMTYKKVKAQLDIVHSQGIIHRDIRPSNILYGKDAKVYLIDFAFSRIARAGNNDDEEMKEADMERLKLIFFDKCDDDYF